MIGIYWCFDVRPILVIFILLSCCSENHDDKDVASTDSNAGILDSNQSSTLDSDSVDAELKQVTIMSETARSCDILFDTGAISADSVLFSPTTRGVYINRSPKLAISITTATDAPFSDDAVTIEGNLKSITLEKAVCYDRLGNEIQEESVVWR